MLKVDLYENSTKIGGLIIVNDRTGTKEVANYNVTEYASSCGMVVPNRRGRVENFDRSRGAWALVGEAVKELEAAHG